MSFHPSKTEPLWARYHAACRDTAVNKVDLAPALSEFPLQWERQILSKGTDKQDNFRQQYIP